MPHCTMLFLTLLLSTLLLVQGSTKEDEQHPTVYSARHRVEKKGGALTSMRKRSVELPTSWHLGKRSPWAMERSSWLANLVKPLANKASQGKRSLPAWIQPSTWVDRVTSLMAKRDSFFRDWIAPDKKDIGDSDVIISDIDYENDAVKRSPNPIQIEEKEEQNKEVK